MTGPSAQALASGMSEFISVSPPPLPPSMSILILTEPGDPKKNDEHFNLWAFAFAEEII